MIVRMGLIQRLPTLSPKAFSLHWRGPHGTAAARMPGLLRYQQNHVTDWRQLGLDYPRGAWALDGFSQLWFEDVTAMRAAITSPAYTGVAADTPNVMTMPGLIVAEPHVVRPVDPAGARPAKRMSVLRRKPGVSPERFRHEWLDVHAGLVSALPNLAGYTQNLVFAREVAPNVAGSYDDLPIDGVAELWFADANAIVAAFASPAGRAVLDHARQFIAEITTFLVKTCVIVGNQIAAGPRGAAHSNS